MKEQTFTVACIGLLMAFAACSKNDNNNNNGNTSQADINFMQMASYSNHAEIDAGQLASGQASDASVKAFGSMMVTDHSTAETDLQMLASQKSTSIPATADSMHIAMKAQLMTMSGRMFDSTYMHMQSTDHQNTINLFQMEISGGNNQDVKNYATKYLPKIQMHKQMVDSIITAMHM